MIKVVGFVHVKPQSKMDDDVWGTYVSGNQPIVLMDDETIFFGTVALQMLVAFNMRAMIIPNRLQHSTMIEIVCHQALFFERRLSGFQ